MATAVFLSGIPLCGKLRGFFQMGLLCLEAWLTVFRALVAKGEFYLAVHFYPGENHPSGGRIKVSSIQPPQVQNGIFVPLIVVIVQDHQVWGEQGVGHPGDVLQGELEGAVEHAEVVEDGGAVPGTDVLLATEGGDGDGVRPEGTGLHAREATVDVPHATVGRGDEAAVHRDKAAAVQGLDEFLFGPVL